MSFSSAYIILKKDLKMKPYKNRCWVMSIKLRRKNPPIGREKSSGKKIQWESFFLMKKMFALGSIYNNENARVWSINREEVNQRGGKNSKESLQKKWWYGYLYSQIALRLLFCLKKALSIIIKEVLLVTLRYGNSKFGNNWIFQQNNGTPHTHEATQEWCCQHFPSFIAKDTWPANSPDLNLLNYCIWEEFTEAIN